MDEMQALVQIDLSHNRLSDVTILTYLENCEIVDWSYNRLETIPDSIDGMKALETLDLSHNQVCVFNAFMKRRANQKRLPR